MSRIKSAQIHAIALQVFRDFTRAVMRELADDGLGRDDFTRRQIFTFTCDDEEFVACGAFHVMDSTWSDEIWTRFPRATAERVHAHCRAILDEQFSDSHRDAQRAIMDAYFNTVCAWDEAQFRVMNPRLHLTYRNQVAPGSYGANALSFDVPATGRITRSGRDGRTVFQFVSQCHPAYIRHMGGSVIEVIESEDLFALRQMVADRMDHASRIAFNR